MSKVIRRFATIISSRTSELHRKTKKNEEAGTERGVRGGKTLLRDKERGFRQINV